MAPRPQNRQQNGNGAINSKSSLSAVASYNSSMALIRNRFVSLDNVIALEPPLVRAERIAFQVRKIIEGVAFISLSAAEYRNKYDLDQQRTKDADKLLVWLNQKNMLRLPAAQVIENSPDPAISKFAVAGVKENNLNFDDIMSSYSRASALVHERHPERLTQETITKELSEIENDAKRLRSWLWLNMMFFEGKAFLIQMSRYGTDDFFIDLSKISEYP